MSAPVPERKKQKMSDVYEAPDEVVVIGYVWTNGNASGGKREAFFSVAEAERRLAELLAKNQIKDPEKVSVLRLGECTWEPLVLRLPEPLRIETTDA